MYYFRIAACLKYVHSSLFPFRYHFKSIEMTESDEESFHSATEDFDNDAAPEKDKLFVPKPTAATDAKGEHAAAAAPLPTTSVPSAAPQAQRDKEEAVKTPQKQQQRADKEEGKAATRFACSAARCSKVVRLSMLFGHSCRVA